MTTRANTGILRMAKQTAKGSLVADSSSVFGYNVAGSSLPRIMRDEQAFEEADGNRMRSDHFVASVQGGGDAESYVMPQTSGFLLYCALGGVATTGAGDPYTHTVTVGTRPWVTLWPEWLGREKLGDARLSKLVLSGKTKEPLRAVASWNSISAAYKSAAETTAALEVTNRFLHYDGSAALQLEGVADATIDDWTLTIDNHDVVIGGDSLTPTDIFDGELTIDLVVNRITPSASLRNRLYYGGASPSDATAAVAAILELAGSPAGIDFKFTRIAASRTLELKVPRLAVQPFDPALSTNPSDYLKDAIPLTALQPSGGATPMTAVILSPRATVF